MNNFIFFIFFISKGERELKSRIKELVKYRRCGIKKVAGKYNFIYFVLLFCSSLSFDKDE